MLVVGVSGGDDEDDDEDDSDEEDDEEVRVRHEAGYIRSHSLNREPRKNFVSPIQHRPIQHRPTPLTLANPHFPSLVRT